MRRHPPRTIVRPARGLLATMVMLVLAAGPPGVPRLEPEPIADGVVDTPEDVLVLPRSLVTDDATLDALRSGGFAHLAVLKDWIVIADSPARMASCRDDLAARLGESTDAWSVESRIVQLDPDSPATAEAIEAIRRRPDGDVATALMNGTHPAIDTTLATPRVIARDGESAEVRIGSDSGANIRLATSISGRDDATVDCMIDLEVARERALGRRVDRRGSRAADRRRVATLGRPLAVTTAAFADTTVRELDGGRRTLPRSPESDEPPVVLLLSISSAESNPSLPQTPYRQGEATRDGIGLHYFDREIAQVMGHLGAGWLERPEREREEQTSRLIEMLGLEPGMVVADIGAGSGYFTRRLARRLGPTGRVVATDIQPEMLEILVTGLQAEGIENVTPVLGRVDDCGLAAGSVDLILLVDVYHEFDHPWEMARSMRRALKPGGRIALVEYRANDPAVPIKPLHTMTAEQSQLEFEAAGYRLVENRERDLPRQRLQLFEATVESPH